MESTPEDYTIPMPVPVPPSPPTQQEYISVHSLKFLLEDEKIPKGARKLLWGFYTKFAALTNLKNDDVERLMSDYDYCCLLYLMSRRQPKAISGVGPLKIIEDQFNEISYLIQGRSLLFMQLRRSIDALNLQLMAPRSVQTAPQLQPQREPSRWAKLLGRT